MFPMRHVELICFEMVMAAKGAFLAFGLVDVVLEMKTKMGSLILLVVV